MPDWLYAFMMNRRGHTLSGETLHISRQGEHWLLERGDLKLYSHTSKMSGFGDKYFSNKYESFVKIEQGDTVLDVGGCIGDTTLPMAKRAGKEAKVIAVEPHPRNADCLRRNLEGYDLELFQGVITDHDGTTELCVSEACTGHSVLSRSGETIEVPGRTLDSLFGDRDIDFAKIDVQGFEVPVMKGGTEKFLPRIPKLVVETHYVEKENRMLTDDVVAILEQFPFEMHVDEKGVIHCKKQN